MKTLSQQLRQADGLLPTTHWSVIRRASALSCPEAQQALETLCRAYWYPLYAYLRRQGHSPHEAEDLTQGFFAHLLQGENLGRVEPRPEMRFRSWLLASLRHYVASEWRKDHAQRRGGGQRIVSIDADQAEERYDCEPVDPVDPEKLFERKWVMELLDRVLARLEQKYAAKGKQALFAALAPFLRGDQIPASHREIAARLGLKPAHIAVEIGRLRDRYGEMLRAEVAETVTTREEIEDELRYLGAVISQ